MTDPTAPRLPRLPRLPVSAIDLSMLASCLEADDMSAGYLDPATGEVWPRSEDDQLIGPDGEPVDPDERGWIAVGGEHDPRGAYRDMVEFAESVADADLRARLGAALEGKGAFKRFRDLMYREADATTGRAWGDFRERRAQVRAIGWLVEQKLVGEDDAHRAVEVLTAEPDPATAPRLILLNGMPGVGKSTLAQRYAAEHPGVLLIDADVLAESMGDDPRGPAEAARSLSLELAFGHLGGGADVVVPQLVARSEQLVRYENVARAARAQFVLVYVDGDVPQARVPVAARRHLKKYRTGLAELRTSEPAPSITSSPDDVDADYGELAALLDPS